MDSRTLAGALLLVKLKNTARGIYYCVEDAVEQDLVRLMESGKPDDLKLSVLIALKDIIRTRFAGLEKEIDNFVDFAKNGEELLSIKE